MTDFLLLNLTIYGLQSLGFILLFALLLTIFLSKKVKRHPVFINFLCTWVVYSGLQSFIDVGFLIADKLAVARVLQDSLHMTAQVSTLNLVIHLWCTMRAALHVESAPTERLRTLLLVVSPYLVSLIPLGEFNQGTLGLRMELFVDYAEVSLLVLTVLWDVILLIMFWRRRRILRLAKLPEVMSLSLLTRILVFGLYRLVVGVLVLTDELLQRRFHQFLASKKHPALFHLLLRIEDASDVIESLYALLIFCLLGLQRDILQIWFPCLWKGHGRVMNSACWSNHPASDDTEKAVVATD